MLGGCLGEAWGGLGRLGEACSIHARPLWGSLGGLGRLGNAWECCGSRRLKCTHTESENFALHISHLTPSTSLSQREKVPSPWSQSQLLGPRSRVSGPRPSSQVQGLKSQAYGPRSQAPLCCRLLAVACCCLFLVPQRDRGRVRGGYHFPVAYYKFGSFLPERVEAMGKTAGQKVRDRYRAYVANGKTPRL